MTDQTDNMSQRNQAPLSLTQISALRGFAWIAAIVGGLGGFAIMVTAPVSPGYLETTTATGEMAKMMRTIYVIGGLAAIFSGILSALVLTTIAGIAKGILDLWEKARS